MSKVTSQYTWQKERLRPETERTPGASLQTGYGPDGSYSLFLPSPKAERKYVFKDGKPTLEVVGSCLDIPEVMTLRNRILRSGTPSVLSILFVDAALVEYSAALLRLNYNLSDDDLTFLHSGKQWQEHIIRHALGGEDAVKALASVPREKMIAVEEAAQSRLNHAIRLAGGPQAEVEQTVSAGNTLEELDLSAD